MNCQDVEGIEYTKQDSQALKCGIRWRPMWRRVFTRNRHCVINNHAEYASILELVYDTCWRQYFLRKFTCTAAVDV